MGVRVAVGVGVAVKVGEGVRVGVGVDVAVGGIGVDVAVGGGAEALQALRRMAMRPSRSVCFAGRRCWFVMAFPLWG